MSVAVAAAVRARHALIRIRKINLLIQVARHITI